MERVSFSPKEFAALFGRAQTWGYRQIYKGKVKAITEYGRIQIPAAEVKRILDSAGRYEGMPEKAPKTKAQLQKLAPQLRNAWRDFIAKRKGASVPSGTQGKLRPKPGGNGRGRAAALARLVRKPAQ